MLVVSQEPEATKVPLVFEDIMAFGTRTELSAAHLERQLLLGFLRQLELGPEFVGGVFADGGLEVGLADLGGRDVFNDIRVLRVGGGASILEVRDLDLEDLSFLL